MLTGLSIRDVVLIEALDLEARPGLTVLTGETGAGKSIILDALGLALGGRSDAGLVRTGASQASVTATFDLAASHAGWSILAEAGIEADPGEALITRRQVSSDGRSRAFINDQPASVGTLRRLGDTLVEVHGQHDTVGLLDGRQHGPLLDSFADLGALRARVGDAWAVLVEARASLKAVSEDQARSQAENDMLTERLATLDRLDPRPGEEAELAETRALLGASEKALADVATAREALGGEGLSQRLAQALRAVDRARERALAAGATPENPLITRLSEAHAAIDRTLVEAAEAQALIDQAAQAFDMEPGRLEKAEERLFALRAEARRLGVAVDDLPRMRDETRQALLTLGDAAQRLSEARRALALAEAAYDEAAQALSQARQAAAQQLAAAVQAELAPLKLDKAAFRVAVEADPERAGPSGIDRIGFEVRTNPGAPFGPLQAIASGGELARLALALKVVLAAGDTGTAMVFDEVDQGVGGAVADAVGQRLRRLAEAGQVMVVTHSPQVAARGHTHWKILKVEQQGQARTQVVPLDPEARQEELARMLAGELVTDQARAAARALLD